MWFFETPPVFHWFFANVNACCPLTGIIRVFGHVGGDLLQNHPRPAMYCALRMVKGREKSRMRTTYQKTSMRFGFFRACAFLAKKMKSYGFFWQCKRYNKKPVFFYFGFCQCKWAYWLKHANMKELILSVEVNARSSLAPLPHIMQTFERSSCFKKVMTNAHPEWSEAIFFHLFLEYGELPALSVIQITFNFSRLLFAKPDSQIIYDSNLLSDTRKYCN